MGFFMNPKCKTYNRKKIVIVFSVCFLALIGLAARLVHLMIFESEYYQELAQDLHERERSIKAARGKIVDASGTVLATNRTVCTISVVHSQIEDPERVIEVLSSELGLSEETGKGWRSTAPLNGSRRTWKRKWEIESGPMSWQG